MAKGLKQALAWELRQALALKMALVWVFLQPPVLLGQVQVLGLE
jgi:hypothetical protein